MPIVTAKQLLSKKFVTLLPEDTKEEIERKLNSDVDFVVVIKKNPVKVYVLRIEVAKKLYGESKNKSFFQKLLVTTGAQAKLVDFAEQLTLFPGVAFAVMNNVALQAVYLHTSALVGKTEPPIKRSIERFTSKRSKKLYNAQVDISTLHEPESKLIDLNKGGPKRAKGMPKVQTLPFNINAYYQKTYRLEEEFQIKVDITKEGAKTEASLPVMVKPEVGVDILIQSVRGFEIVGTKSATIVPGGKEEEAYCYFTLKGKEIVKGQIRIYAFQEGDPLGRLEIEIAIIKKVKTPSKPIKKEEIPLQAAIGKQPDLKVMILEHIAPNGETEINFQVTADLPDLKIKLKDYGTKTFTASASNYCSNLFKDIEKLNMEVAQNKNRVVRRLELLGADLYEKLIPEELQVLLWENKDRIKTVTILSDEPWIPWEICRLHAKVDGIIQSAGFLCELFELTRWMPKHDGVDPALAFKKLAVVIPNDSNLKLGQRELKTLQAISKSKYQVTEIPATYKDLTDNFASGQYSLWHFSGHGETRDITDPDRSEMILNGKDRLSPLDISDTVKNLGIAKPLVFLNACQIGKTGFSLTGVGGWAPKFISSGASVFIGAYWAIIEDAACKFTQEFYNNLFVKHCSVGRAVKEARKSIKALGDPTWLAFTVYADPHAKVV